VQNDHLALRHFHGHDLTWPSAKLIGTIRGEYLGHVFYWNAYDLQRELDQFKRYFNEVRVHAGIGGRTPDRQADLAESKIASLGHYRWRSHCQGLFAMPEAA